MIEGLLVLLGCQLLGELATRTFDLRVPGPVIGMLLLLALLAWRRPDADAPVVTAADRLLDDLPLLFVPAGVGIVTATALLREQWLPITVGMVLPWAAGLALTAVAARVVLRRRGSLAPEGDPLDLVDDTERIEGLERDR